MSLKDKCITSFASRGREEYNKSQLRLIKSCVDVGWAEDCYMSSLDGYCDKYMGIPINLGTWPINEKYGTSWQQIDNPYQFKPYQIQAAREQGYTKIIWADSSITFLKNPTPLFEIASERGILAYNNLGYPVVNWTNDHTLKYFKETTKTLDGVKQIMACFIVFDFDNPITCEIFEKWVQASLNNCFMKDDTSRQGFIDTRNDQSALSILLHQYNIPLSEYGEGFCYHPHQETKQFGDHVIYAINRGL